MTLTEAEARKRWCPFARSRTMAYESAPVAAGSCIASQCMAWQWRDSPVLPKDITPQSRGYCGLAPLRGAP